METAGVEPAVASVQARVLSTERRPQVEVRTGGVEPPQRAAAGLRPVELANARRPRGRGGRPGSNRRQRGSQPRVLPTTPRPPWTGTTGLEPATSRLTSECSSQLSYAPIEARGWDSNPRSRAHEAREDSRSSTAQGLAGRSRTCDLRRPKPAGWPSPPQPDVQHPRRDSNPQLPG